LEFESKSFSARPGLGLSFLLSSDGREGSVSVSGVLGPFVGNDNSVWEGLVRSDLDFSVGFSSGLELSWSDGELVSSLGALLSQHSDWDLDGSVLLNDDLVFPKGLWNLKGQASSELSGNAAERNGGELVIAKSFVKMYKLYIEREESGNLRNVSVSSDLVSSLEGDLSDSGDDDWSLNLELDGPSHKGWDFPAEFNWSGGLLGVNSEWLANDGVPVFLSGDLSDEFSEFGGYGEKYIS